MFLFCSQRNLFVVITFLGVVLFLFVLIYKYTTSDQSSLLLWGHRAGQEEGIQGCDLRKPAGPIPCYTWTLRSSGLCSGLLVAWVRLRQR